MPTVWEMWLAATFRISLTAWLRRGLNASTVRNVVVPVRVLYRRALDRGDVAVNPVAGIRLPAVRSRKARLVSPAEMEALLRVLQPDARAIYATAAFAGLRLGEIRALRWEDVDLEAGVICVEHSWDRHGGFISPKSRAGNRTVPIPRVLGSELLERRMRCPWLHGLVFGRDATRPFEPTSVTSRARRAWEKAGLNPIGLHEARHVYAAFMIGSGVDFKAISTSMGHSTIAITIDLYGGLVPGNEAEAARRLDAFMERGRDSA